MTVEKRPTLLVMAGGTGGHIFPGIAVAEYLQAQGWHIHWLGTAKRMEAQLVPQHGFDISFINIAGLRNKNWQAWLKLPFKLIQSVWQSMSVIRQVKPDVVLGMGGYASAPGGFAAWLLAKPLVLHEQNAVAGLSNRFLARLAVKVLSAFPGAFKARVKHQVVGNPLRSNIVALEQTVSPQPSTSKKVLVVGGSLGAKVLNDTVPQAMKQIKLQNINVWHQTGKGNQQAVLTSYQDYGLPEDKVKVTEFIDDMSEAYQWADVVICRAGALTVSELAMAAKPAIFVPLPHAVDDHQTKNAMYLVQRNAAKMIAQKEFNGTSLAQMLNSLFVSDKVVQSMSKAAHDAAHADATARVAQTCMELVK
ncbi:UDP-N-acetylglucosamine--N-acetylmuramyl-(pentapeptide) pyrophosphoryl-undecaprenol N-acetylglucosamine transferase [Thalassotalea insulae]|uniref:UDP-N-acetylglucosamine--N-acetylmuramyl-(pentapeptide) pyrophosphoryl-undecaprenol N-acetylglucosamine transferase n=1 Tax=Thalassotalea insulae TaxID=2056778 RepID=A0ABQ6GQV8_9GAMM|nr:undecaprenyldiphospho-muramoylpentapeptide beta-N-acetylglucosaminyltransferase [Thalassotalea insulae]GLX77797.1 UDP-N-acetylglucosamine--N-acetylmuramyl-(pentapeptide) pyrophosphoryl-undecaprenol N-acetylglucosamine transferase [Thalassotalea insulae]